MQSTLWTLDAGLSTEQVEALLGGLAARGLTVRLHAGGGARVLVLDDPPPGLERPAGVLRASTVEVPEGSGMRRREFLDTFAVALGGAVVGGAAVVAGAFSLPPEARREHVAEMDVGLLPEIEAAGSKRFRFGRDPCVVVHNGGKLFALSLVCTHLGCLVHWSKEKRVLECPCHRASFDLEGNVLEGPPPRPLTSHLVSVQDDRVLVRRRTAP